MINDGETELQYFGRRAMEEAHAASQAACPRAAAIHRRLAAVYAMRLREEEAVDCALEQMLIEIDEAQVGANSGASPG